MRHRLRRPGPRGRGRAYFQLAPPVAHPSQRERRALLVEAEVQGMWSPALHRQEPQAKPFASSLPGRQRRPGWDAGRRRRAQVVADYRQQFGDVCPKCGRRQVDVHPQAVLARRHGHSVPRRARQGRSGPVLHRGTSGDHSRRLRACRGAARRPALARATGGVTHPSQGDATYPLFTQSGDAERRKARRAGSLRGKRRASGRSLPPRGRPQMRKRPRRTRRAASRWRESPRDGPPGALRRGVIQQG